MPYANSTTTAPHSNNAALPNQSPYQQRTTQRDNPTQQLIKQAVDFLIQQLEAGKSETLAAYLAAMARFHSYSFGNILQIARQRPTATRVAGFYAWKEFGRFVKRGEKGIQILAPMVGHRRRKDTTEQEPSTNRETKPAPTSSATFPATWASTATGSLLFSIRRISPSNTARISHPRSA
jgi:hypothetical protein